jgi:ribosome biogenesis GTPase / thiamine phosphate phosphatase
VLTPDPSGWHDALMPRIDMDALEDEWDDDFAEGPRGRPLASPAARAQRSRQRAGRVVAVDRGRIRVVLDPEGTVDDRSRSTGGAASAPDEPVDVRYGGAMRGRRVVVGDRVRVAPASEGGTARVVERLERTGLLRRTSDDLDAHVRVVAANIDHVLVVVGADNLASGLRFADRVIVAATDGGAAVSLVVNKIDLAPDLDAVLAPYADAVTEVWRVSAQTGEGVDRLRSWLTGRWTVLTGHSGVGKSSLTNLLAPDAAQQVGAIGRRGGRHTTVASIALPLSEGGWLVDTPGVRSFGLGMLDRRGLAASFPELVGLPCRLDDCRHAGEPGCALPEAGLHPDRLAAFQRLADAIDGVTPDEFGAADGLDVDDGDDELDELDELDADHRDEVDVEGDEPGDGGGSPDVPDVPDEADEGGAMPGA